MKSGENDVLFHVEHLKEIASWLNQGLADFGLNIDERLREDLSRYFALLLDKNKSFNLISSKMALKDMVAVHLLDSLAALKWPGWSQAGQALDIGSGAGLPAIPLSLTNPNWNFTLAESTGKKASFLKEVQVKLNLKNVTIANEYLIPGLTKSERRFDLITARAVSELKKLISVAGPRLKLGGIFLAYKGPRGQEEITNAQTVLKQGKLRLIEQIDLTLPLVEAERHLYFFQKNE